MLSVNGMVRSAKLIYSSVTHCKTTTAHEHLYFKKEMDSVNERIEISRDHLTDNSSEDRDQSGSTCNRDCYLNVEFPKASYRNRSASENSSGVYEESVFVCNDSSSVLYQKENGSLLESWKSKEQSNYELATRKFLGMTKRQLIFLFLLTFGNFLFSSCYSVLAPFFPKEAELKGASPLQYGLVFGVYQLIIFIACPVFGKLVPYYSTAFLLNSSIFVVGVCSILFGLLDKIEAGIKFITFAFLVRSVEAFGTAIFFTAAYAAVPDEFPENPTTIYSVLETSYGVGMISGPSLGGTLYEVGGFVLPFAVLGCLLLAGLAINFCNVPEKERDFSEEKVEMLKVIVHPGFVNDVLLSISYCIVLGFNEATLEAHLRQFDLTPSILGAVFVIIGAVYAVSTIFWGILCERKMDPHTLGAIGCVICALSCLITGPVSFIPVPTHFSLVVLGQVLMGCGTGAQVICAYVHALKDTVARGFPDNTATFAAVSGILNSCAALGSFIGPSVGGALLEWFGYRKATVVIFVFEVSVAILVLLFKIFLARIRSYERDAKFFIV